MCFSVKLFFCYQIKLFLNAKIELITHHESVSYEGKE